MTAATLDPFTATADGERIRILREIAARGPVERVTLPTGLQVWLVTGWEAAREALNDPRLLHQPSTMARLVEQVRPDLVPAFREHVLTSDGEVHARRRRLVMAAFARRAVERLEPRIRELADALLADLESAGPEAVVDLHGGFAYPLPMAVICELLGIPEAERERFHRLTVTILTKGMFIPREELGAALDECIDLITGLIAAKRACPDEALITALVEARDGESRLSEDELTAMILVLTVAGHETTANLLANGTAALLSFPEQLERLRADPALLPPAVEELLRLASPILTSFPLIASTDLDVAGVPIAAGELVLPSVLAANRDPRRFAEPDVLDIARPSNHHLAFGHGPHHCLGVSLAKLEARIGFGMLLERYPHLRLAVDASELRWQPNIMFNGLTELPVRLGPPASARPYVESL